MTDDSQRPTHVRYFTLGWLCAAAMLAYVHRGMLSVPIEQIADELKLDTEQASYVLSAFFLSYALFQIPAGYLGDRFGSRKTLVVCVLVGSLAAAATSLPLGFGMLCVARLVIGAAQAGMFPCCVSSFGKWFPVSERTLPSGFLTASMSAGGVVATALVGFMLYWMSWQTTFLLLSLPGFLWAAAFWFWFRDRPEDNPRVNAAELAEIRAGSEHIAATADDPATQRSEPERPPTPWLQLITSPLMWLICWQHFFRAAGIVFLQTWFPTYLQKARAFDDREAGLVASLALLAVIFGSLSGGALADRILARTGSRRLSRQGLALVSTLGAAVCLLLSYLVGHAGAAVTIFSLGCFFAGLSSPIAYTISIDVGGAHVATVFTTMNMAGNLGGIASPLAVGKLVEATGERWDLVVVMYALVYLAAAICWLPLDPNRQVFSSHGKNEDERREGTEH